MPNLTRELAVTALQSVNLMPNDWVKMFSIIIPAYNEENVIANTLSSMLADNHLVNVEFILVCNGCHDATKDRVDNFVLSNQSELKSKSITFHTLDTSTASKTNAVNIGNQAAQFPERILVDADILVSGECLVTLHREMLEQQALVASPKIQYQYQRSDFWVRHYYRVASQSNYNQKMRISNVICLSKEAVSKLIPLPEVIADDDYIRRQFTASEKWVSHACQYEFICPTKLRSLLKALTRVHHGNQQLAKFSFAIEQKPSGTALNKQPLLSSLIFVSIKLYIRWRAKWQQLTSTTPHWERDESSRNPSE